MKTWWTTLVIIAALMLAAGFHMLTPHDPGWTPHVLFSGVCCTDGTRFADMDGDGRPDIVTSIEESGEAVILFSQSEGRWTSAIIGKGIIKRPEDTLPFDIDNDGDLDLLVSQENRSQKHTVCFNPGAGDSARKPEDWVCEDVPATKGKKSWLIAEPIRLSGGQMGFVIGGKENDERGPGSVALLIPGQKMRDLAGWTYLPLADAPQRVMTISVKDFNGDGIEDIAFVDGKGDGAGLSVLEQPLEATAPWTNRRLSQGVSQASFGLLRGDLIYSLEKAEGWSIVGYEPHGGVARTRRPLPSDYCDPRSFVIADFNSDKAEEFAVVCREVRYTNVRAYLISAAPDGGTNVTIVAPTPGNWFSRTKYDAVYAVDMDGDGDLDLLTDEETYGGVGQGVIWYENPGSK